MTKLPNSKTIKELAELLDATSLTEIEVETDGLRIRVARDMLAAPVTAYVPPQAQAPAHCRASRTGSRNRPVRYRRRFGRPSRRSEIAHGRHSLSEF